MKDDALIEISRAVRDFLQEHYLFGYGEEACSDDASLMEHGVLDSLGILELITFIESEFGVQVADDEILPENLDSIDAISRFVRNKTGKTGT
jgi:acyl carrier protein